MEMAPQKTGTLMLYMLQILTDFICVCQEACVMDHLVTVIPVMDHLVTVIPICRTRYMLQFSEKELLVDYA